MMNGEEIERYMQVKRVNGQSELTIHNQTIVLNKLSQYLGKPFRDATEQEIVDFINSRTGQHGRGVR